MTWQYTFKLTDIASMTISDEMVVITMHETSAEEVKELRETASGKEWNYHGPPHKCSACAHALKYKEYKTLHGGILCHDCYVQHLDVCSACKTAYEMEAVAFLQYLDDFEDEQEWQETRKSLQQSLDEDHLSSRPLFKELERQDLS